MTKEKIFFIAGEDSGDLHGAKLISEMKKINPSADFYGIGGNRMQKEGLYITEHISNLNIIGLFEVIKHYARIKKIFNDTLLEIKKIKPDKVVLIDYPGFNLRMAKKLYALNFDVTYLYYHALFSFFLSRIIISFLWSRLSSIYSALVDLSTSSCISIITSALHVHDHSHYNR